MVSLRTNLPTDVENLSKCVSPGLMKGIDEKTSWGGKIVKAAGNFVEIMKAKGNCLKYSMLNRTSCFTNAKVCSIMAKKLEIADSSNIDYVHMKAREIDEKVNGEILAKDEGTELIKSDRRQVVEGGHKKLVAAEKKLRNIINKRVRDLHGQEMEHAQERRLPMGLRNELRDKLPGANTPAPPMVLTSKAPAGENLIKDGKLRISVEENIKKQLSQELSNHPDFKLGEGGIKITVGIDNVVTVTVDLVNIPAQRAQIETERAAAAKAAQEARKAAVEKEVSRLIVNHENRCAGSTMSQFTYELDTELEFKDEEFRDDVIKGLNARKDNNDVSYEANVVADEEGKVTIKNNSAQENKRKALEEENAAAIKLAQETEEALRKQIEAEAAERAAAAKRDRDVAVSQEVGRLASEHGLNIKTSTEDLIPYNLNDAFKDDPTFSGDVLKGLREKGLTAEAGDTKSQILITNDRAEANRKAKEAAVPKMTLEEIQAQAEDKLNNVALRFVNSWNTKGGKLGNAELLSLYKELIAVVKENPPKFNSQNEKTGLTWENIPKNFKNIKIKSKSPENRGSKQKPLEFKSSGNSDSDIVKQSEFIQAVITYEQLNKNTKNAVSKEDQDLIEKFCDYYKIKDETDTGQ